MLQGWIILVVSFAYLSLLFAIAYYGDKRARAGRSLIGNPYTYALSIAVYCTSWTFYGSVGRAASSGVGFLPIYLGPTLMAALWWFVLRKMLRISKLNRITSIADFIASRYGKSMVLGGLVTVIAVVGIMPYISLQLKAVSTSFNVIMQYPETMVPADMGHAPILQDTALYVALLMAAFSILFGTRHIDATEHHEGMVAAIAFESVVKLAAFLAVGVFVTFGLYQGFGDLFRQAAARPELEQLFKVGGIDDYLNWISLTFLAMMAIICLPRQFQVAVVENVDESHLNKAVWLFPLYLLLINIFVLPIAFAGLLHFPQGTVDGDTFVLALPMAEHYQTLALFAFLGGLSAATGMVIVATIALSTMVCNDLVMPLLLRMPWLRLDQRRELTGLVVAIRRVSIVFVLLLGYIYFRLIGESYALVTIGLVSFVAAAQFAPAAIIGIFWKGATRKGALTGLTAGSLVWFYTLLLPSFARSGWISDSFLRDGPFGLAMLRPYELFGLSGLDHISHALFWTMLFNLVGYIGVSLLSRQSLIERNQATRFVEVFQQSPASVESRFWRGIATVQDLQALVARFVGRRAADQAFADYARRRGVNLARLQGADADVVYFTERLLAGAIGAASARVMVASVVKGANVSLDEVMTILDEASHVIEYSRQLEQKSAELEAASTELRAANERLKELDRLKDEFLSTVTHELRTPLTSIRSFSEILYDNPDLTPRDRHEFLQIIIKESQRLTRLINELLDFAKIEAGRLEWQIGDVDLREVVADALAATAQIFRDKGVALRVDLPDETVPLVGDRDRLMQVMLNLLSNAAKFCDPVDGRVQVTMASSDSEIRVSVRDNGPGISPADQPIIFDKFRQAGLPSTGNPQGTGLGLAICKRIVEHMGGRIWVESEPGRGATFSFVLPRQVSTAEAVAG